MEGEIHHQWRLPGPLGNYAQLLPTGNLLVTLISDEGPKDLAAAGGRIVELDWDGKILWDFTDHLQHHDFNRTPSGNTLYLAWELIPTETAEALPGGIPNSEHPDGGVYMDVLREVNPAGELVWEWRMIDHFPLDRYRLRPNHRRHEFAHANTAFVQPDGNIMISWRQLDVIAEIDRQSGKMLWDWEERRWGGQHDCRLLENGNITLFANGTELPGPAFSRVLELDPQSRETVWEYKGSPIFTFFSPLVSGAELQPNGNMLICEGNHGRLFEVSRDGDIVWEYVSPFYNVRRQGERTNQIFRVRKYAADSPEINGRLKLSA